MDAAPLPEYEERLRMANRLQVAWPWLLVLTLASAMMLHRLGFSGLGLVLGPAVGGLVLTLVVVLQARRPGQRRVPAVDASDPVLPLIPTQTA